MKKIKTKYLIIVILIVILGVLAYLRFNPQSTFERAVESMGYEIVTESDGITPFNAKFENGSCILYKNDEFVVVRSVLAILPATQVEKYVYRIENSDGSVFHIVPEETLKDCN